MNNFKSLKKLRLFNFIFINTLSLKLTNLEDLTFCSCENIELIGTIYYNMKNITFLNFNLKTTSLLELPELVECKLQEDFDSRERFSSKINFSNLKNIKNLKVETRDFLNVNCPLLEEVELYPYEDITKEEEIKMLEKILSLKYLKNVILKLNKLLPNDFINISGENTSIIKIILYFENKNESENQDLDILDLTLLQNKFPNLIDLSLDELDNQIAFSEAKPLEINENQNSKITKISLGKDFLFSNSTKLYIQSYETLEEFKLSCMFLYLNDLPFFSNNLQITFKSLIIFDFKARDMDFDFDNINNLYNNIDNMPNLKNFGLICFSENVDLNFFKKFVKKILNLHLMHVVFELTSFTFFEPDKEKEYYSFNELKEMFPKINIINCNTIHIAKFKSFNLKK